MLLFVDPPLEALYFQEFKFGGIFIDPARTFKSKDHLYLFYDHMNGRFIFLLDISSALFEVIGFAEQKYLLIFWFNYLGWIF